MITVFDGETADEAWRAAAVAFQAGSGTTDQPSRGGNTSEILHAAFTIRNPRQRWVVSRKPAINPAFALAEVVWILNGSNDAEFLNFWNPALPSFAGTDPTYHGAYGFRLRRKFGFDQLSRAYKSLSSNPDSRQVVLLIWDPTLDLPDSHGTPAAMDIPCNIVSLLKVRDGRLFWTQVMRSNDLFLGVPHNFVQFTSLQEIMAGWLGLDMGDYDHFSDSLHIYEQQQGKDIIDEITVMESTDSLYLAKPESEQAFEALYDRAKSMTKSDLTQDRLRDLTADPGLPAPFKNILAVMAAESSRRRGWHEIAQVMIEMNKNPLLDQAWERWRERSTHNSAGRK